MQWKPLSRFRLSNFSKKYLNSLNSCVSFRCFIFEDFWSQKLSSLLSSIPIELMELQRTETLGSKQKGENLVGLVRESREGKYFGYLWFLYMWMQLDLTTSMWGETHPILRQSYRNPYSSTYKICDYRCSFWLWFWNGCFCTQNVYLSITLWYIL